MIPRMNLGLESGEYDTFEELEIAAQRRERYLKISKAPPAPETSILPNLAYREAIRKGPAHRLANLVLEDGEADLIYEENPGDFDSTEDPEYLALLQSRRPQNKRNTPRQPKPQRAPVPEELADKCFNCTRSGHISRDCQEESRVFCRSCGKVGCTRSTCPDCPPTERSFCTKCGSRGVNVTSCKRCAGNAQ